MQDEPSSKKEKKVKKSKHADGEVGAVLYVHLGQMLTFISGGFIEEREEREKGEEESKGLDLSSLPLISLVFDAFLRSCLLLRMSDCHLCSCASTSVLLWHLCYVLQILLGIVRCCASTDVEVAMN